MRQSALPQCITALWLLLVPAPVHCRLRHCQPVRQRTPSSTTRRNQYDAAEALYPAHDDAMTSLAAAVSIYVPHMAHYLQNDVILETGST